MTKQRTQQRGICIMCGKEHALQDEKMVAHGYTIDHHQQHGNCSGVGLVHYGHTDAPQEIMTALKRLERQLAELPSQITAKRNQLSTMKTSGCRRDELTAIKKELAGLQAATYQLPRYIDWLKDLRINWEESPAKLVDLDIEEAEERKARQEAATAKKAEREEKAKQKAEKAAERKAKAAAKWNNLCKEQLHQVELDGEILIQWVASYSSRKELENDHYERCSEHLRNLDDIQDRLYAASRAIHRIRENEGKHKQLHKW